MFCKFCGSEIEEEVVVCPSCGKQVRELEKAEPSGIVINNVASAAAAASACTVPAVGTREKNKWVALGLCFFGGIIGAHKFYEEKPGQGLLYLFTCGIFGIGWFVDMITIAMKPNPYYV